MDFGPTDNFHFRRRRGPGGVRGSGGGELRAVARAATSPAVLVRVCDGVRVAMIAAPVSDEEDRVVVEPVIPLG